MKIKGPMTKECKQPASGFTHAKALYCYSGHINVALTASDQALMLFIVAMGPFTAILLRSFLFMISPKLSLEGIADYGRLLTRGL